MKEGLSVFALHEFYADEENACQQRHQGLCVDMSHLVQQIADGFIVLPERKGLPVSYVGIGYHASHHALVEAADGENGMFDGGLGLAYLEHEYTPEGAIEVAR